MARALLAVVLLLPAWAVAAPARLLGQWIWCEADRRHFERARLELPALVPAIHVATVTFEDGEVRQHLALSPRGIDARDGVALVVRFDDSLHAIWRSPAAAEALSDRVGRLVDLVEAPGTRIEEIQLDYDCPVRRLGSWAAAVSALAAGPLHGRQIWITSLPSHISDARYGDQFRAVVAGHVLQLFDTALAPTRAEAERLLRLVDAQRMPFRIGLGAFERAGAPDAHGGWFDHVPLFAASAGFRGVWVFPGGMPSAPAIAPLLQAIQADP